MMHPLSPPVLATALLALAACAAPVTEPEFQQISEFETFRTEIVGKRLVNEDVASPSFLLVNADGTMEGIYEGTEYTGVWRWEDGYFCRTSTSGFTDQPENCQRWDVAGDRVRSVRDRGAGQESYYTR